jgi:hypothetical protein
MEIFISSLQTRLLRLTNRRGQTNLPRQTSAGGQTR